MIELRWVQDTQMVERQTPVGYWVQDRRPHGLPVLQYRQLMQPGVAYSKKDLEWKDVPTVIAIDGGVL